MNPTQAPVMDVKTKAALYQVIPSGKAQTQQPNVALELMRGNTDVLDRIHPQLGPGLFVTACLLLVFGLWLKRKEKKRKPADDDFAGMC